MLEQLAKNPIATFGFVLMAALFVIILIHRNPLPWAFASLIVLSNAFMLLNAALGNPNLAQIMKWLGQ